MQSFCFVIAFHNLATLGNWLIYQCPSYWPVCHYNEEEISQHWGKKP
jgi:hypothetical protein